MIDQFLVAGRSKWGQTSRADAAAAARIRGQRPRALERAARAVPPAGRAGQHPDRELHDRGPVLPPAPPPGARRDRPAAGRDDAEGPAPPQAGRLHDRGPLGGLVPAGHPRPDRAGRTCAGSSSAAARSTTTSSATSARPGATDVAIARLEQLYPFPVEALAELLAGLPRLEEIVWAQEEPQNMGALALDPPPARRRRPLELARGRASPTSAARGAPRRARGIRPRTRSSRTASCGPRSASQRLISAARALARGGRGGGGHLRPVRPRRLEQEPALCRGKLAPHAVREQPRSHRILSEASAASAPWSHMPTRSLSTRCHTFRRFRPLRSGMASDRAAPRSCPRAWRLYAR